MLRNLRTTGFSNFNDSSINFVPGMNVFIGENNTKRSMMLSLINVGLLASCKQTSVNPNTYFFSMFSDVKRGSYYRDGSHLFKTDFLFDTAFVTTRLENEELSVNQVGSVRHKLDSWLYLTKMDFPGVRKKMLSKDKNDNQNMFDFYTIDEPEAHLDPTELFNMAEFLSRLNRQSFISTNSYFIVNYLDTPTPYRPIRFHSFYEKNGMIKVESKSRLDELEHNVIRDGYEKFTDIFDKRRLNIL